MSTTTLRDYLLLDDRQRERLELLAARYRQCVAQPEQSTPLCIVQTPVEGLPTWEERIADPRLMLQAELDTLRPHLAMEDDRLATVRVQFGTAQIPAAFGCTLAQPTNSLPAAATHVLHEAREVYSLARPSLDAGWYGKLQAYTECFREQLPAGIAIQHPDIQSPFNNAHLIRGNDILLDFYDDPEAVCALLDLITDYMLQLVPHLKRMISDDPAWFFDWGALWKGAARLSNCSMHMISPQWYAEYVLPRDRRLLETLGGGRMHYCGSVFEVIPYFFHITGMSGLDIDAQFQDPWAVAKVVPAEAVLCVGMETATPQWARLLSGDWPRRHNLIIMLVANSFDEGQAGLAQFRAAAAMLEP